MPVVQGDATTDAPYRQLLGQGLADVLFTDPPYCLLTRRRRDGDLREPKGKKLDRGPVSRFEDVKAYRRFTRAWLEVAARFVTPRAPLVVWTNLLGREVLRQVAGEHGWAHLRGEYVWGKRTRKANSGEELLRVVETALVLSRVAPGTVLPGDVALPWAVVAGYDDDGEAAQWGSHPNHKPFGVLEPLVRTWTRPGDVVLDPFSGSGSISAACARLGRMPVALELEPTWAARADERLRLVGGP